MWKTAKSSKYSVVICFIIFTASVSGRGNCDSSVQNPTDIVWKWHQTTYSDSTKTVPSDPEKYTLQLLPDGRVSIKADCNLGGGNYNINGSQISIKITHTTMAACPEGSYEMTYIRDIDMAARFHIKGDILYLDLKKDSGIMLFLK